jgi:hypothetical protein
MGRQEEASFSGRFTAFWMQIAFVRPKWLGWANRVELQLPIIEKVK